MSSFTDKASLLDSAPSLAALWWIPVIWLVHLSPDLFSAIIHIQKCRVLLCVFGKELQIASHYKHHSVTCRFHLSVLAIFPCIILLHFKLLHCSSFWEYHSIFVTVPPTWTFMLFSFFSIIKNAAINRFLCVGLHTREGVSSFLIFWKE